jgi:cell division protein FtsB
MREKAHFRRYAQLTSDKKDKNYLLLYDALEPMTQFDEQSILDRFKDHPIGKYLSSEINYLLGQILKSLINFQFEKNQKQILLKKIQFIEILAEKGFDKKALKILRQAKKEAYKYEEFSVILRLIQNEEEMLFQEGILNFTQKLKELKEERNRITQQIQNLNELRLLREQARELQFTETYINHPEKHPLIFENPLIKNSENALSIHAKDHWFYINEFCCYITRRYKDGQGISGRYLKFMKGHEYLFKKARFLPTYSNYLYFSALTRDDKTFYSILKEFELFEKYPQVDLIYVLYIKYSRLMELHYQNNDLKSTEKLIGIVGEYYNANYKSMGESQVNYTLFLMTRACIETNQLNEASDWLNIWNQTGVLEYTLIHSRLFAMMIHFELGWTDLLSSETSSGYKTLKKHKKYDNLAIAFFAFFRDYLKYPDDAPSLFRKLSSKLKDIKDSKEDNKPFEYYDYLKWAKFQLK